MNPVGLVVVALVESGFEVFQSLPNHKSPNEGRGDREEEVKVEPTIDGAGSVIGRSFRQLSPIGNPANVDLERDECKDQDDRCRDLDIAVQLGSFLDSDQIDAEREHDRHQEHGERDKI